MSLQQYDIVRVSQLLKEPADYNGWGVNQRAPRVGEVGTIVDILQASGLSDCFVVECCDPNGVAVWVGDFASEELEPAEIKQGAN